MSRLAIAALIALTSGCTSEQLNENQQGWREAECDRMMDTPLRERCLAEVRRYNEQQQKKQ